MITSANNPRIKQARALRNRKERRRSGLYLVEGLYHLGAAQEAGAPVDYVLYSPESLTAAFGLEVLGRWQEQGLPCHPTRPEVLAKLSDKESPPAILAVVQQEWTNLEDLAPQNFNWGVALQTPQDPGNLGSILRSLDAAGASGLILLDGGVDPFHPSAVRASLGALFWHPLVAATSEQFLSWAQGLGYNLYGSSAHGNRAYDQLDGFHDPAILLLGNERQGLSSQLAAACLHVLRLPMEGHVTSLNLSVAAGILLFHMAAHKSEEKN